MPDELWLAIRQYLTRMQQLDPGVGRSIAERLAGELVARTGAATPQGVPAAAFLAAVVHERQSRDARRVFAGPRAGGPVPSGGTAPGGSGGLAGASGVRCLPWPGGTSGLLGAPEPLGPVGSVGLLSPLVGVALSAAGLVGPVPGRGAVPPILTSRGAGVLPRPGSLRPARRCPARIRARGAGRPGCRRHGETGASPGVRARCRVPRELRHRRCGWCAVPRCPGR